MPSLTAFNVLGTSADSIEVSYENQNICISLQISEVTITCFSATIEINKSEPLFLTCENRCIPWFSNSHCETLSISKRVVRENVESPDEEVYYDYQNQTLKGI